LSAARLMSRVQDLGLALPLAVVFTHPTPALLAAHATQLGADAGFQRLPSDVVPAGSPPTPVQALLLRPGLADAHADRPPLWLLHELSGTAMPWLPLSRSLAGDRTVMGLCLSESCTAETLLQLGSLQALAAAHVQALRNIQQHGPYHLAGWSVGGLLAQEVAVQLGEQGEQVAYLALLDAPWPGAPEDMGGLPAAAPAAASPSDTGTEREAILAWVAQMAVQALPTTPAPSAPAGLSTQLQRWADPSQTPDIDQLLTELQASPWWPHGGSAPGMQAVRTAARRSAHLLRLVQAHRVRAAAIPVHYIAAQPAPGEPSPLQAWQRHWPASQGVHTDTLATDHARMLASAYAPALAALIDAGLSAAAGEASPWVVIQAGRPGVTPWLCVPGAGANVTCFVPLAQALGPDVPVYGLQPRGLDRDEAPYPSVEAAAAAFALACRRHHAVGPVHLLGHSFGGWIACELAFRLQAQGWPVASLNLVDSMAPSALGPRQRVVQGLDALMALHGLLAQQCGHDMGLSREMLAPCSPEERLHRLQQAMRQAGLLGVGQPEAQRAQLGRLLAVFERNLNTGYVPSQALTVPTRLLCAAEHHDGEDRAEGWALYAPQAVAASLPGNHMTVLQSPQVQTLVRALSQGHRGQGEGT
jgi:thioesterase domain-containing protein